MAKKKHIQFLLLKINDLGCYISAGFGIKLQ